MFLSIHDGTTYFKRSIIDDFLINLSIISKANIVTSDIEHEILVWSKIYAIIIMYILNIQIMYV